MGEDSSERPPRGTEVGFAHGERSWTREAVGQGRASKGEGRRLGSRNAVRTPVFGCGSVRAMRGGSTRTKEGALTTDPNGAKEARRLSGLGTRAEIEEWSCSGTRRKTETTKSGAAAGATRAPNQKWNHKKRSGRRSHAGSQQTETLARAKGCSGGDLDVAEQRQPVALGEDPVLRRQLPEDLGNLPVRVPRPERSPVHHLPKLVQREAAVAVLPARIRAPSHDKQEGCREGWEGGGGGQRP